jgi:hypothetical protein
MNECLTIDDEDEEDHRWFFSCQNPYLSPDRQTHANRNEFFSLKFYSGIRFFMHGVKKQVIFCDLPEAGYREVITR